MGALAVADPRDGKTDQSRRIDHEQIQSESGLSHQLQPVAHLALQVGLPPPRGLLGDPQPHRRVRDVLHDRRHDHHRPQPVSRNGTLRRIRLDGQIRAVVDGLEHRTELPQILASVRMLIRTNPSAGACSATNPSMAALALSIESWIPAFERLFGRVRRLRTIATAPLAFSRADPTGLAAGRASVHRRASSPVSTSRAKGEWPQVILGRKR